MRITLVTLAFLLISILAFGQPGENPPDPGEPVPLTGLEILLAAGALLGVRRFYQKKKTE